MKKLNVAILHPDLGIGGAERLIVDVALALQDNSFVSIYTSHYDRNHCFEETQSLSITTIGDQLPRTIFNKFYILCSMLRQLWLVIYLIFSGQLIKYDLIILDQLSYCIPLINLFKMRTCKVIFYCHFPDKLLASHEGCFRQLYRKFWDSIEEWSMSRSDSILVNSNFTKDIVKATFKTIQEDLHVVYPCVNDTKVDELIIHEKLFHQKYVLSINRFERKKGIDLAIRSFSKYRDNNKSDVKLVIAGGYDLRVPENVHYLNELRSLCDKFDLKYQLLDSNDTYEIDNKVQVYFWVNISNNIKNILLAYTELLLYTPRNEHFGIVPIEAMKMGTLVLADVTGGPLETILNYYDPSNAEKFTGFNVDIHNEENWAETIKLALSLKSNKSKFNCQERVQRNFSSKAMKNQLYQIIDSIN